MTPSDVGIVETISASDLADQPFAESAMGDSMDSDLLPELSGETWVATTHLDEATGDLALSGSELDLITSSHMDKTLTIAREWVRAGSPPPWSDCAGFSPELRLWHLQFGNLSIDLDGRLWRQCAPPAQLVVPVGEGRGFIHRYHASIFAGHLGVSRTVCKLLDRVYWPGLREDVHSYLATCSVCLARKSPCPRRVPMGHVSVGFRWDRVAMDILDMSVTTDKGNRYVLVIVDCFSGLRHVLCQIRRQWRWLMHFIS